jgi:hypothetical protein
MALHSKSKAASILKAQCKGTGHKLSHIVIAWIGDNPLMHPDHCATNTISHPNISGHAVATIGSGNPTPQFI